MIDMDAIFANCVKRVPEFGYGYLAGDEVRHLVIVDEVEGKIAYELKDLMPDTLKSLCFKVVDKSIAGKKVLPDCPACRMAKKRILRRCREYEEQLAWAWCAGEYLPKAEVVKAVRL